MLSNFHQIAEKVKLCKIKMKIMQKMGSLLLNAYFKFGFSIMKITLKKRPGFRWRNNFIWSKARLLLSI